MRRYIDADKIEYEDMLRPCGDGNYEECQIAYRDRIDNIPIADVRENVKGEWIRNDNGTYSCSVCQAWIPEEQHYYARYCLHCGAEMEDEQE